MKQKKKYNIYGTCTRQLFFLLTLSGPEFLPQNWGRNCHPRKHDYSRTIIDTNHLSIDSEFLLQELQYALSSNNVNVKKWGKNIVFFEFLTFFWVFWPIAEAITQNRHWKGVFLRFGNSY